MYERMLDKECMPNYKQFIDYCGNCKNLFEEIDAFITETLKAEKIMRFPYGKSYGWGIKYFIKSKHICDIFAEKDAFTVMIRLDNVKFENVYNEVATYTKEYIDNKYPCGNGGWIQYRVLTESHLEDIKKILQLKVKK